MAEQLVIKINGDIKNYEDSLNKLSKQTKAVEEKLGSIAKKSALAFAGLTAAVVGSIKAFRTQEQAEIRTIQTIKATGGAAGITAKEIFKMASSLQDVTTFGDEAIISGQNMLLTFKNIGEDVFPRTTEIMLDMSEAMGVDLKSTAIQLGKALNDPIVGLTALSRVGITFTEQQKDQIKVMQKSGDIVGAQTIILKELESQFGGVARASAEGTGQFIQLSNIMGDLVEDLGKEFLPMLSGVTASLKGLFTGLREQKELIKMTAQFIAFGVALSGGIAIIATIGVVILKLSVIIGALSAVFLPATIAASGFWIAVTGPIGLAVAGIVAVTAAVVALFSVLDKSDAPRSLADINKELDKLSKNKDRIEKLTELGEVHQRWSEKKLKEIDGEIKALEKLKSVFIDAEKEKSTATKETSEKNAALGEADIKRKEDEKARAIELEIEKREELREINLEQDEIDLGIKIEKEEADLERQILVDELKNDQEVMAINKKIDDEKDKSEKLKLIQDRKALIDKKRDDLRLKQQFISGKQRVEMDAAVNQQLTSGAFTLASTLVSASGASAKKQFIIQRTLGVAQVLINAYMAKTLAEATIPPPAGEIIGANRLIQGFISAGIIAAQAGIQFTGMAHGGVVSGGIPGVDSVPILAQRNEIINPAENYDELIGSVRAKREAEKLTGGLGGGGQIEIIVSYDSPEASQIITVSQVEDSALGISQDSFKEAS